MVAHRRDRRVDGEAEHLLGLLRRADLAVGPTEHHRDADTDRQPGDAAEQRPAGPRAGCAEALLGDRHRLGALQRGEHQLALILLEGVELLEHHRVLAAECVELGAGDGILDGLGEWVVRVGRSDEDLALDLVDLCLELLEPGERGGQPVLAQLVLTLGEVRGQLVAEGVGDLDGVVGGGLRGADPQGAGLLVGDRRDRAGELRRRPAVVDRLGGAQRHLAGGGEQLDLVERLRVGEREPALRRARHEDRVARRVAGDRVGRALRRRQPTDDRAADREQHDHPPETPQRVEWPEGVHRVREASCWGGVVSSHAGSTSTSRTGRNRCAPGYAP